MVVHLQGSFAIGRITIGSHTTMRAYARLMSGGEMCEDSVMLEHTLALPGEVVDHGMAWQGW